jgi:formate-dependent nitrite reductase cytochrome c552 subunit
MRGSVQQPSARTRGNWLITATLIEQDLHALLKSEGVAHPVSCVDCHDPKTMALRVTRPGFVRGIRALAARCARSSAASATSSTTAPGSCR